VTDLEAKAEDLDRRGTSYERRREEATAETLWVDTGPLGMPGLFEFAEVDELGSPLWEGPTGSS
jgi:hypothetical protein